MSKIKLTGHASGTGVLTVTAPNTSTDRTITLPDSTGTLATTADNGSQLDHSGTKKLEATSTGATLTGDLAINDAHPEITFTDSDDTSHSVVYHSAGAFLIDVDKGEDVANSYFRLSIDDTPRLRVTADGLLFNSDTAAANALDDYEEGTYAAVVSGSTSGTFAMATENTLAYTKIGRLVTVQGYVGIQSGSVGGNVRLSLPFAPTALTEDADYNFPSLMIQNQGNTIAGQKYLFLQVDGSAYFYRVQDSGAANYISNGDVDGNFEIGVSFTYISG